MTSGGSYNRLAKIPPLAPVFRSSPAPATADVMMLSQCPQCDEKMMVPAEAMAASASGRQLSVDCPWCGEQSPLSRINTIPIARVRDESGEDFLVGPTAAAAIAASPAAAAASDEWAEPIFGEEPPLDGNDTRPSGPGVVAAEADSATADAIQTMDANAYREHDSDSAGVVDQFGHPNEADRALSEEAAAAAAVAEATSETNPDRFQLAGPAAGQGIGPSAGIGPATATVSRSVTPMKGRRKPKSSAWKSLVGAALGPFFALGLGYLILSAVGKVPDWGFWPFDGNNGSAPSARRTAAAPLRPSTMTPDRSASAPPPSTTMSVPDSAAIAAQMDDPSDALDAGPDTLADGDAGSPKTEMTAGSGATAGSESGRSDAQADPSSVVTELPPGQAEATSSAAEPPSVPIPAELRDAVDLSIVFLKSIENNKDNPTIRDRLPQGFRRTVQELSTVARWSEKAPQTLDPLIEQIRGFSMIDDLASTAANLYEPGLPTFLIGSLDEDGQVFRYSIGGEVPLTKPEPDLADRRVVVFANSESGKLDPITISALKP